MTEVLKTGDEKEPDQGTANGYDQLRKHGEEHPFDRQKAEQLLEDLEHRRDIMSGHLKLAEQVSDLRQSEPIRQGVRMETAKIEDEAAEGLPSFADEDELVRNTNRHGLIKKKRVNAIEAQHNFEDGKHELLMSTEDMETPTGMSIKEVTDDTIAKAIWNLQMGANSDRTSPDEVIEKLNKIQQLRDMRTKLASGVADSVGESVKKAQEMQDIIQESTVKGIKAPEAPSIEETRMNQDEIEKSQQEIDRTVSSLNQEISDLEQKIREGQ